MCSWTSAAVRSLRRPSNNPSLTWGTRPSFCRGTWWRLLPWTRTSPERMGRSDDGGAEGLYEKRMPSEDRPLTLRRPFTPPPPLMAPPPCRNWASSGTCQFGASCRFLHDPAVPGGGPAGQWQGAQSSPQTALARDTTGVPCKNLVATGTCKYGARCTPAPV